MFSEATVGFCGLLLLTNSLAKHFVPKYSIKIDLRWDGGAESKH